MKIIYIFLLGLGVAMAPEPELGLAPLLEEVGSIVAPYCSIVATYSYNANVACINIACLNTQIKSWCDKYFTANIKVRVQDDDSGFECKEWEVMTPFGGGVVSGIEELPHGEYGFNTLPDIGIEVIRQPDDVINNYLEDPFSSPPPEIHDPIINLKVNPYPKFDGIECAHEFNFTYRESGTYKATDLLLAMAKFIGTVYSIVHKHNQVVDINKLVKKNALWLARMKYDCAAIANLLKYESQSLFLQSDTVSLKCKSQKIGHIEYYPGDMSMWTSLPKLCGIDMYAFDSPSGPIHNSELLYSTDIYYAALCKKLGTLTQPNGWRIANFSYRNSGYVNEDEIAKVMWY